MGVEKDNYENPSVNRVVATGVEEDLSEIVYRTEDTEEVPVFEAPDFALSKMRCIRIEETEETVYNVPIREDILVNGKRYWFKSFFTSGSHGMPGWSEDRIKNQTEPERMFPDNEKHVLLKGKLGKVTYWVLYGASENGKL